MKSRIKYYSGIGSRKTPPSVLDSMREIAIGLEKDGYILRSGGARGADSAFAEHVTNKEIFRPTQHIPSWAYETVDKYHPGAHKLSPYVRKLHARNAMIVLGEDGQTPSEFIICWTPNGKVSGGTGQALRIALDLNIEIINLGSNL